MTKINMEALRKLESEYPDLKGLPRNDPRLVALREPLELDEIESHRWPNTVRINKVIDQYLQLAVKNNWTKAEMLYWLNKSGPLRTHLTNSQIETRQSYTGVKLKTNVIKFDHNDQEHIDRIILNGKRYNKSFDQIAMNINDLGYGAFVDAPYVNRRYHNLIPKHEIKPELTSKEKRIIDVQIEIAMNTEMSINDLVQYLNKMPKIKHEVTRDVVAKRAKRMHIKLEGM